MSVQALSCAMALRGVSPSEKLLLLVLANYADEHMRSFPSHSRLAGDTGLSERTILTLMKALEARRMLSRKQRMRADGSRSTDIITIHFGGEVVSPRGAQIAPGVGKSTTGGGEVVSPLTTFEPSLEEPSEEDDDGEGASATNWDTRLEEAKVVGGQALDLTSTALWTYRDLRDLCEPQAGEPCEWGDVLDAIRFRAAKWKARGGPRIRSWTWVKDQALAYRDRRLAGLRAPEAMATGPPGLTERIGAEHAEARRIAFEMLDAKDGRTN